MKDKPTKEELERVYSDSGTLKERLEMYPYIFSLLQELRKGKKRKGEDFYSIFEREGLSRETANYIADFVNSPELAQRLKIGENLANLKDTLRINTKKYLAQTRREEKELEEALSALSLYELLLSIREIVSPEEWKSILEVGKDSILRQFPKYLAYSHTQGTKEEDGIVYNFRGLEVLIKQIYRDALQEKYSLKIGVDVMEGVIEEYSIRSFFNDKFLFDLEEAKSYIYAAEKYLESVAGRIENRLSTIPLSEEEKSISREILSGGVEDDVYRHFLESSDKDSIKKGLRDYVKDLLDLKIKKSDYEKLRKQILKG